MRLIYQPPRRSPPFLFARAIGPPGRVERVECGRVLVGEREVEDLRVLLDPLAMRRLREHDQVALDAPADEDLRGRAIETVGDLSHAIVVEVAARSERAVRLDGDAAPLAALQQRAPVLE